MGTKVDMYTFFWQKPEFMCSLSSFVVSLSHEKNEMFFFLIRSIRNYTCLHDFTTSKLKLQTGEAKRPHFFTTKKKSSRNGRSTYFPVFIIFCKYVNFEFNRWNGWYSTSQAFKKMRCRGRQSGNKYGTTTEKCGQLQKHFSSTYTSAVLYIIINRSIVPGQNEKQYLRCKAQKYYI